MVAHHQGRAYFISTLTSASVFATANYLNYVRPVHCADCFTSYGLPFAFLEEGGFFTIHRILWVGLAADIAVLFALAVGVAGVWQLFSARSN